MIEGLSQKITPYSNIKLEGGSSDHLLVMNCGLGLDLSDVISHQDIAMQQLHLVCHITMIIAKILEFLKKDCGVNSW